MRSFRDHDETEYEKLRDWSRQKTTKGSNKDKPDRPDVAIWYPPVDVTSAAFLQNALGLEKMGGRTQYLNLPEVEMVDKMCGGHKQVSMMVRNIYDRKRVGALRATAEGVTGNPILRVNITFSSTPEAARAFYKKDMTNGFFGRIPFAYKGRGERIGKIPRQGSYDEEFLQKLDEYLVPRDPLNADRMGLLRWTGGRLCVNFGKKKGTPLMELFTHERNWLKWFAKGNFETDARMIVQDLLDLGRLPPMPPEARA
jgi:hypothetical protein